MLKLKVRTDFGLLNVFRKKLMNVQPNKSAVGTMSTNAKNKNVGV